jgi:hypothetical protein
VPHPSVLRVRSLTFLWVREGSPSVLVSSENIDPKQPLFPSRVIRPTAPRPVLWMTYQFPHHRIRMHVLQFFFHLLRTPHIEIVKPPLPESRPTVPVPRKRQGQLSKRRSPRLPAQGPGNFLFQNLQRFRWRNFLGFTHQQVNVFRHHHISNNVKSVPRTHFIEYLYKAIARPPRSKKRTSPITTEGHEVKIAQSVITPQRVAHRRKTRTLKTAGCGTQASCLQGIVPG